MVIDFKVNKFAALELLEELSGDIVTYYSICYVSEFDEDETEDKISLFEDFLIRHEDNSEIEDEFNDLITWLDNIAYEYGANKDYFRPEKAAEALPPPAVFLDIQYKYNLRLYCMRINDNIVILFNGGVKSADVATAQECPVVKPYFEEANRLAIKIEELLINRTIKFSANQTQLIFDQDLEIIL